MAGIGMYGLAFLSAFAFVAQVLALPADLPSASTTTIPASSVPTRSVPITATTIPTPSKENREPKDAKSAGSGASKDLKDVIKAGRDGKKAKKDCSKEWCTGYDPICVYDPADTKLKPRTFASPCALEVYNCEMGTKLAIKSQGECPGSGGVRLS